MIELVLAFGLLGYTILWLLEIILSKKTFNKIIYHSKITRIIAMIISFIGMITIVFGLVTFLGVVILAVIKSGYFKETLIDLEFDKKPVMVFLTVIGALVFIYSPWFIIKFLPGFGGKKK